MENKWKLIGNDNVVSMGRNWIAVSEYKFESQKDYPLLETSEGQFFENNEVGVLLWIKKGGFMYISML